MNEQSNAPMSPDPGSSPAGFAGWFSTWMMAVTKPNEQVYTGMANSPEVKATTAYLWVFIGSLVNFFITFLVQGSLMTTVFQQMGIAGELPGGGGFGTVVVSAICGAPIAAVIGVIGFVIGVAIVQWVAKMFSGHGTFDQMAYMLAAVLTPFYFINAILTLLAAIPFIGLCFGLLGLGVGLYALYLELLAIKSVNQFGWGPAIGSLFLPGVVLACCAIAIISVMTMLGGQVNDTFNSINQSLVP